MKKKEKFIPLKSYGLGLTTNSVLSFIKMYGETYASNTHISERLEVSTKTITRSIKKLEELGYIEIYNPKGRSRFIKLIKEPEQNVLDKRDIKSIPYGQNVQQDGQDVSVKLDNKSHNNKEDNKLNNKTNNKAYNKLEVEVEVEEVSNDIFTIPTSISEEITNENWTSSSELLNLIDNL